MVFDDEIVLNDAQKRQFDEVRKVVVKTAKKLAFEKQNNQFDRSMPPFFKRVPGMAEVSYVMLGNKRAGGVGVR